MYLRLETGTETFERVFYFNYKKVNATTIKVTVVGQKSTEDAIGVTYQAYNSYLIKGTFLQKRNIDKCMEALTNAFQLFRTANEGVFRLDEIVGYADLKIKPTNSIVAKNLLMVYSQISTINGFFSDKNTLIAISGYALHKGGYNLFCGSIRVARVLMNVEIDDQLLGKIERMSFEKHSVNMDLVLATDYIEKIRLSSTTAYKSHIIPLKFELVLGDVITKQHSNEVYSQIKQLSKKKGREDKTANAQPYNVLARGK